MKPSKSKLALAKVINENGGWPSDEFNFAAQDKIDGESNDNTVSFYSGKVKPTRRADCSMWRCEDAGSHFMGYEKTIKRCKLLPNWHQTCLSREEYYHAYPKADADGWIEWKGWECPVYGDDEVDVVLVDGSTEHGIADEFDWHRDSGPLSVASYRLHAPEVKPEFCESVMRSIPEPEFDDAGSRLAKALELVKSAAPHMLRDKYKFDGNEVMGERKPTIEQLAADYRNAKDYAERKQQEADDAKVDADSKLKALELAGEAIGLTVSPITERQAPELVITDWRQWRVGDVVSWSLLNHAVEFEIISVHHDQSRNIGDFEVKDKQGGVYRVYGNECRFIRRP